MGLKLLAALRPGRETHDFGRRFALLSARSFSFYKLDTEAALIRAQRNEVHMLVPVERADVKRKLTTLYERIRLLVLRIIGYIVINYMFQSDSHGAEKV